MRRAVSREMGRLAHRRGTILIVTIWVVLVLAGLAMVFARSMRVAALMAANEVAALQAECIVDGVPQYIMAMLAAAEEGDATYELMDSEPYEAMEVGDGYFWVLRSNLEDDEAFDYGLTDESGKINLNSASEDMLLKLPGMTAELAASIIDWRDEDSEVTTGGAEDEYYLLGSNGYNCKNAEFETVEEILLVRGATEELLYGEDTNLNGVLDDHENDGDESEPDDDHNGQLDAGFYDYVTVYSVESNLSSEGESRIDVNDADSRTDLQTALEEAFGETRALEIMIGVPTSPSYDNILAFFYDTGLTLEEFGEIADLITTSEEETLPGMVNVNTAPKEVLMCLPDMEESDAEALISYREAHNEDDLTSIAWVTGVLDQELAVAIGSYITVKSSQYSADIVCVSGNGRAYRRYKAVIDVSGETPRIAYWRSLTHFGWPLDREIITALRTGQSLERIVMSLH